MRILPKIFVLSIAVASAGLAGCNDTSFIDHVDLQIAPDLQSIAVSMVFATSVQSTFSGSWEVKNYGDLFIEPYSTSEPFTVGFNLDVSVLNDQDWLTITPTNTLPNGVLIGIGYPLVQIQSAQPISSQFDLYGYVDITNFDWLGMAGVFALADKYFPTNLSINQVLMRDSAGLPEVIGAAFGPVLNLDGSVARQAGVALFANVHELIAALLPQPTPSPTTGPSTSPGPSSVAAVSGKMRLVPQEAPTASGPGADQYNGHMDKINALLNRFADGLSGRP